MRLNKEGKYTSDEKKQPDDKSVIFKPKVKTRVTSFRHPEIDKEGYLQCDGAEIPKNEYNDLYYKVGDTVKAEGYPSNSMLTCVGSGTSGDIHTKEPVNKDAHHRNKRYYNLNHWPFDNKDLKDLIKSGAIKGESEHPTNKPNSKVDHEPDNISIDELIKFKETASTATYQKKVYEIQMKINEIFDKYIGHKLDSYLIDKIFNDVYNILTFSEIHKITAYDILLNVSKQIHDKVNNDYANPPDYYDDKITLTYMKYFSMLMNVKECQ